jgi:acyl-[acyl carrier protein]--UDP-N-acetylglucosamine O-acyltransferase
MNGSQSVWEHINRTLKENGYYTTDQLIELAQENEFILENPYSWLKKGTKIAKGAIIRNGSRVDGSAVSIGEGTELLNAMIKGSDIVIGKNNLVNAHILSSHIKSGDNNEFYGKIELDNFEIGSDNKIIDLYGDNKKNGKFIVGNNNWIKGTKIDNRGPAIIEVGHANKLFPGLNLNCVFPYPDNEKKYYRIKIGNKNSLGRDGGGVISTSYRFESGWGGHVLIGSGVETTRGAEILGWSLMGFTFAELTNILNTDETGLKKLFKEAGLQQLEDAFNQLLNQPFNGENKRTTSLYGVTKIKRTCLVDRVQVKDDVRTLSAYLRNFIVMERCKVYFSNLSWSPKAVDETGRNEPRRVHIQDIAIEYKDINGDYPWETLSNKLTFKGYPEADYSFYE